MIDTTLNPALMLNFKSEIEGVITIDLTGEEDVLNYPPLRGNITQDPKDNLDASTVAHGHSTHRCAVWDESFLSVAPSHMGSAEAPAVLLTSVLQNIPTALLVIDQKSFSPKSIDRMKALMLKENRTQTLIKVETKEAATCFDVPTSQDEKSYDGDVSEVDEEDAEVIPDEEDDTQVETSKPTRDNALQDNEGQEEINKKDDNQTAKSGDKKPV